MLKAAPCILLVFVLALFCVPVLHAKDSAAYRIGDVATEDIIAPVALDMIDPAATAALKASEALKTPAIFISCSDVTNAIAKNFLAAFADARSNFVASIQDTFQRPVLDDKMVASPDFGYLVTAFNFKNKNFPVSATLAADWARGDAGIAEQNRCLALLLQTMQCPARPDDLPAGFVTGETVCLVPAGNPSEKLTVSDAEALGQLVEASSVTTISRLRAIFRGNFSTDDELPLARALAALLEPNCIPDAELTKLARDRAVAQLVVAEHFTAGQLIVRQGDTIDAKVKAVLDQLNEKLTPGFVQPQITAEQPASPAGNFTQQPQDKTLKSQSISAQNQILKIGGRKTWLTIGLTAAVIVTLPALKRLISRRRRGILPLARETNLRPQNLVALQSELAPGLVRAVKEALVRELAVQRRELLLAQQSAAAEIAELVRRLDELQSPLQERLRAYESQIQKLEQELAERTQENRELLRLKIEMTRHQLEIERTRNRAEFN